MATASEIRKLVAQSRTKSEAASGAANAAQPEPVAPATTKKRGKVAPAAEPDVVVVEKHDAPLEIVVVEADDTAPAAKKTATPRKAPAKKAAARKAPAKKAVPSAPEPQPQPVEPTSPSAPLPDQLVSFEQLIAAARQYGLDRKSDQKLTSEEIARFLEAEFPEHRSFEHAAIVAALEKGFEQAREAKAAAQVVTEGEVAKLTLILQPSAADGQAEVVQTSGKKRKKGLIRKVAGFVISVFLIWWLIFVAVPWLWRSLREAWIIILPHFGSSGILVPATNLAKWLAVGALTVGFVWLLVRTVRSNRRQDRKVPVRRKGGEPIDRAKDFKSYLAYGFQRWGAVIGVLLLGVVILGIAAIPFREVRASQSYTVCRTELPTAKGQPVVIYTTQGMASCANQLLALTNKSKDAAHKAQLAASTKLVHDEYCRITRSGAQAVTDCEAKLVINGKSTSQAHWPDWTILFGVIAVLSLAALYIAYRMLNRRSAAPNPTPAV